MINKNKTNNNSAVERTFTELGIKNVLLKAHDLWMGHLSESVIGSEDPCAKKIGYVLAILTNFHS